jgi:hypothetical protein
MGEAKIEIAGEFATFWLRAFAGKSPLSDAFFLEKAQEDGSSLSERDAPT